MTTEMELVPGYDSETGVPTTVQKHYSEGAAIVKQLEATPEELAAYMHQQTAIVDLLSAILLEMKVHSFYLQTGFGIADEPDSIRSDIQNEI